jgi:hypothetical protein
MSNSCFNYQPFQPQHQLNEGLSAVARVDDNVLPVYIYIVRFDAAASLPFISVSVMMRIQR